jgi:FkbM family methyltransferase
VQALGTQLQQLADTTTRIEQVGQNPETWFGAELSRQLRIAVEAAAARLTPVPPSREYQYYKGLNAVGVLNYEDDWLSGERRFLTLYLERNPEATVVDVGANVGHYAEMVRALAPRAKIYAIEPHPLNFKELARNSRVIRAKALNFAVGERTGTTTLFDYADADGSEHASVYREVIEKIHGRPAISHKVPCARLDNIARQHGVSSIGLLKIDTEGHELAVLKSAKRLIKSGAVDVIQFEFNEMNVISRTFLKDFIQLLPDYDFFRLLPDGVMKLSPYSAPAMEVFAFQNIVCVRQDFGTSWLDSVRDN